MKTNSANDDTHTAARWPNGRWTGTGNSCVNWIQSPLASRRSTVEPHQPGLSDSPKPETLLHVDPRTNPML